MVEEHHSECDSEMGEHEDNGDYESCTAMDAYGNEMEETVAVMETSPLSPGGAYTPFSIPERAFSGGTDITLLDSGLNIATEMHGNSLSNERDESFEFARTPPSYVVDWSSFGPESNRTSSWRSTDSTYEPSLDSSSRVFRGGNDHGREPDHQSTEPSSPRPDVERPCRFAVHRSLCHSSEASMSLHSSYSSDAASSRLKSIATRTEQESVRREFSQTTDAMHKCVAMHETLCYDDCVCRLIEVRASEISHSILIEGFPYSLSDRIGKLHQKFPLASKAILQSCIEAIRSMHRHHYAHGNIHPGTFVWCSSSFAWKLILESSLQIQDPLHPNEPLLQYMAPELLEMTATDGYPIPEKPADMWSFGILAYKVVTGYDFFSSQDHDGDDYIRDCLSGKSSLPSLDKISDPDAREMLENLLIREPSARWSADAVASCSYFQGREGAARLDPNANLIAQMASDVSRQYLTITVAPERLLCESESVQQLEHMQTRDPCIVRANRLLKDKDAYVYAVNERIPFRLRLANTHRSTHGIKTIQNLHVLSRFDDKVPIEFIHFDRSSAELEYEIFGIIDPFKFTSGILSSPCACYGHLHHQYVQLTLKFTILPERCSENEMEVKHDIFVKIISRRSLHMQLLRLQCAYLNAMERLPQCLVDAGKVSSEFTSWIECFCCLLSCCSI